MAPSRFSRVSEEEFMEVSFQSNQISEKTKKSRTCRLLLVFKRQFGPLAILLKRTVGRETIGNHSVEAIY